MTPLCPAASAVGECGGAGQVDPRLGETLLATAGAFVDGYDDARVEAVLGPLSEVTALDLVIVWDYADTFGPGGDSDLAAFAAWAGLGWTHPVSWLLSEHLLTPAGGGLLALVMSRVDDPSLDAHAVRGLLLHDEDFAGDAAAAVRAGACWTRLRVAGGSTVEAVARHRVDGHSIARRRSRWQLS